MLFRLGIFLKWRWLVPGLVAETDADDVQDVHPGDVWICHVCTSWLLVEWVPVS